MAMKTIDLIFLQDQEVKDGVTADGRDIEQLQQNHEGEVCAKCKMVGEDLQICSVREIFSNSQTKFKPRNDKQ